MSHQKGHPRYFQFVDGSCPSRCVSQITTLSQKRKVVFFSAPKTQAIQNEGEGNDAQLYHAHKECLHVQISFAYVFISYKKRRYVICSSTLLRCH